MEWDMENAAEEDEDAQMNWPMMIFEYSPFPFPSIQFPFHLTRIKWKK
jgi:hypothetical protein